MGIALYTAVRFPQMEICRCYPTVSLNQQPVSHYKPVGTTCLCSAVRGNELYRKIKMNRNQREAQEHVQYPD